MRLSREYAELVLCHYIFFFGFIWVFKIRWLSPRFRYSFRTGALVDDAGTVQNERILALFNDVIIFFRTTENRRVSNPSSEVDDLKRYSRKYIEYCWSGVLFQLDRWIKSGHVRDQKGRSVLFSFVIWKTLKNWALCKQEPNLRKVCVCFLYLIWRFISKVPQQRFFFFVMDVLPWAPRRGRPPPSRRGQIAFRFVFSKRRPPPWGYAAASWLHASSRPVYFQSIINLRFISRFPKRRRTYAWKNNVTTPKRYLSVSNRGRPSETQTSGILKLKNF